MRAVQPLSCALLLAAAFAMPTVSHAVTLPSETLYFTSDHCSAGCGPSPYAQAIVTDLGGGTLEFNVSLINATSMINSGFPVTFAFNLSGGPTITYSNLTSGFGIPNVLAGNTQVAGPGFPTTSGNDPYHVDGTGYFMYGVLWGTQGGGAGFTGTLTFDVTAAGLTLASLVQNTTNQFMTLDVLANGATGPVDASFIAPLPPAALLFGSALVGMGILGGRRRRNSGLAQA